MGGGPIWENEVHLISMGLGKTINLPLLYSQMEFEPAEKIKMYTPELPLLRRPVQAIKRMGSINYITKHSPMVESRRMMKLVKFFGKFLDAGNQRDPFIPYVIKHNCIAGFCYPRQLMFK